VAIITRGRQAGKKVRTLYSHQVSRAVDVVIVGIERHGGIEDGTRGLG